MLTHDFNVTQNYGKDRYRQFYAVLCLKTSNEMLSQHEN